MTTTTTRQQHHTVLASSQNGAGMFRRRFKGLPRQRTPLVLRLCAFHGVLCGPLVLVSSIVAATNKSRASY